MPVVHSSSFIRPDALWRMIGIRAGQTIVHLGCGAGFYLAPAAKLVGKEGRIVGVDIRADMLAEALSRAEREGVGDSVHVVRANLEDKRGSTLNPASTDWVLVANILHQANPDLILTEARRLVKKDGKVIVIEWDTIATPLGPPPASRVPKQTVLDICIKIGLTLRRELNPSPYHYGLLLSVVPL